MKISNFYLHFMSINQYFEPKIRYNPEFYECGETQTFVHLFFWFENMSISMLGGITITDIQSKGFFFVDYGHWNYFYNKK